LPKPFFIILTCFLKSNFCSILFIFSNGFCIEFKISSSVRAKLIQPDATSLGVNRICNSRAFAKSQRISENIKVYLALSFYFCLFSFYLFFFFFFYQLSGLHFVVKRCAEKEPKDAKCCNYCVFHFFHFFLS